MEMLQEQRVSHFKKCPKGPLISVTQYTINEVLAGTNIIRGNVFFDHRLEDVIGFKVAFFQVLSSEGPILGSVNNVFLNSSKLGTLCAYNPFRVTDYFTPPTVNDAYGRSNQRSDLIGIMRQGGIMDRNTGTQSLFGDLNPEFQFKMPEHIDSFDYYLTCDKQFGNGETPDYDVCMVIHFFQCCNCQ